MKMTTAQGTVQLEEGNTITIVTNQDFPLIEVEVVNQLIDVTVYDRHRVLVRTGSSPLVNVTDLLRELSQIAIRMSTLDLVLLDTGTELEELLDKENEIRNQLADLIV